MPLDTRIPLHKLEVFCYVVELESMSRAAERLYVAQPVVSAHIKSLEERIGAELLYRKGNRMLLTEAGASAYQWATEVLTRSREMAREIEGLTDGSRGAVVIASSMTVGSYLLPPILAQFRMDRPGAQITLTSSDPEHASTATEAGECDFAVLISDDPHLVSPHMTAAQIGEQDVVLVATPDDRTGQDGPLHGSELAGLPFVSSPARLTRQAIVDRQLQRAGVAKLEVVIELGHAEAMKRAVRHGLGLAFLFRSSVADELARGDLREIALADARLTAPVMLLYRREKRFTTMQQDLIAAITDGVGPAVGASHPSLALPRPEPVPRLS